MGEESLKLCSKEEKYLIILIMQRLSINLSNIRSWQKEYY
jgi:hypothetical protein